MWIVDGGAYRFRADITLLPAYPRLSDLAAPGEGFHVNQRH